MATKPGRRDSCGPSALTTTSWLPSTSSTWTATRWAADLKTTTGVDRARGSVLRAELCINAPDQKKGNTSAP